MNKQNQTQAKDAIIYVHYSSEKQNEQSIEGQIRIITDYAEREGYSAIYTYVDRAMTGRNDERAGFPEDGLEFRKQGVPIRSRLQA